MIWAVLRYAGISENWPMVEAMTVWGYAMFVWIPVSVRDISSVLAVPFLNRVGLDPLHHPYRPSSLDFIWYRVCSVRLFPRREHLPGPRHCTSPWFLCFRGMTLISFPPRRRTRSRYGF